jgi:hypothetical protein
MPNCIHLLILQENQKEIMLTNMQFSYNNIFVLKDNICVADTINIDFLL